jgi:hypothetical protein
VIDDASAKGVCPGGKVLIVTKRDLARRGSAAIVFMPREANLVIGEPPDAADENPADETATHIVAKVDYAIHEPYRPWHGQRRFSREARGLPPYRRPKAGPAASPNRAAQPDPQ